MKQKNIPSLFISFALAVACAILFSVIALTPSFAFAANLEPSSAASTNNASTHINELNTAEGTSKGVTEDGAAATSQNTSKDTTEETPEKTKGSTTETTTQPSITTNGETETQPPSNTTNETTITDTETDKQTQTNSTSASQANTQSQAQTNPTTQSTKQTQTDKLAQKYKDALPDGIYAIRSDLSLQLVIDACGGGTTDGTIIQTYAANNTQAQMWKVTHDSNGYITLININSNKALDVCGGIAANGTQVQLYTPNNTKAQMWIALPYGKAFTLISALSASLALDVTSGQIANNIRVQIFEVNNTPAQHWYFTEARKKGASIKTNCEGNTILPMDLEYSDYALLLPSYATINNTYIEFDQDVVIGPGDVSIQLVPSQNSSSGSSAEANGANTEANGATETTYEATFTLTQTVINANTSISIARYITDITEEVTYIKVYDLNGNVLSVIYILRSANITSMFLISENPTEYGRTWIEQSKDHSNSAQGTIKVINASGQYIYDGKLNQIKGRGNTTWECLDKKSYQIKLDKKTDLLQTGDKSNKAKTWVLITDGFDWSSSKNVIAYSYAKLLGISSAIDFDIIDLYYDGEYRGTYLLCEKVQIGSGRVDIEDLEDTLEDLNPDIDNTQIIIGTNSYGNTISYGLNVINPEDISGGYLIEHDNRYQTEKSYFCVWNGSNYQYFVCKSPDIWSFEQANYISCLFQDLFDAFNNNGVVPNWRGSVRAGKTTKELIDTNSFAKLYWIDELLYSLDGLRETSSFFYKDKDSQGETSLIYSGPAWDFDLSCGTGFNESFSAEGWYTRNVGLSASYMNDPYITQAIENNKTEAINTLRDYINNGVLTNKMDSLKASLKMNNLVWKLHIDVYPDIYHEYDTYIDAYKTVVDWINARLNWIEAQT